MLHFINRKLHLLSVWAITRSMHEYLKFALLASANQRSALFEQRETPPSSLSFLSDSFLNFDFQFSKGKFFVIFRENFMISLEGLYKGTRRSILSFDLRSTFSKFRKFPKNLQLEMATYNVSGVSPNALAQVCFRLDFNLVLLSFRKCLF